MSADLPPHMYTTVCWLLVMWGGWCASQQCGAATLGVQPSAAHSPCSPVAPLADPCRPLPVLLPFPLPRSVATILNNAPLLLGALCCMAATSLLGMLGGRFLAGLGAGAASVLVPRYVSEIAPIPIRGALGTLNQVNVGAG